MRFFAWEFAKPSYEVFLLKCVSAPVQFTAVSPALQAYLIRDTHMHDKLEGLLDQEVLAESACGLE
jgi:hypothetical protein